jgi:hypothetical protein
MTPPHVSGVSLAPAAAPESELLSGNPAGQGHAPAAATAAAADSLHDGPYRRASILNELLKPVGSGRASTLLNESLKPGGAGGSGSGTNALGGTLGGAGPRARAGAAGPAAAKAAAEAGQTSGAGAGAGGKAGPFGPAGGGPPQLMAEGHAVGSFQRASIPGEGSSLTSPGACGGGERPPVISEDSEAAGHHRIFREIHDDDSVW